MNNIHIFVILCSNHAYRASLQYQQVFSMFIQQERWFHNPLGEHKPMTNISSLKYFSEQTSLNFLRTMAQHFQVICYSEFSSKWPSRRPTSINIIVYLRWQNKSTLLKSIVFFSSHFLTIIGVEYSWILGRWIWKEKKNISCNKDVNLLTSLTITINFSFHNFSYRYKIISINIWYFHTKNKLVISS